MQHLVAAETMRQIHEAIDTLPKACKLVFTKLYIEGKSVKETAEELSLTKSTIKTQRTIGLQILRKKLLPHLILSLCMLQAQVDLPVDGIL